MLATLLGEGYSGSINFLESGNSLSQQASPKKLLRPVLDKRYSNGGLALLICEAHALNRNPDVAQDFFNDSQVLVGKGRPSLLILAGTPDTSLRLNGIETTFWNRLDKIGIGLLDMAASHEALRIPLEGWAIESWRIRRWIKQPTRHSAMPTSFRLSGENCIGPPSQLPRERPEAKVLNPRMWFIFLGQAALTRQALQSRKSARRVFLRQRLTASRALAPAFDQRHSDGETSRPLPCLP